MNLSSRIPESYKDITIIAIKGIVEDSDTVICTTNKKLMTFFNGCLTKNCFVDIEVKQIEPFVVYEPAFEVYYILHGDNKVVIVKEGISLEIITTYDNVYEIVVSDHTNSGTPQLYMKTDQGFECIDVIENKDHSSNQTKTNKLQETSVVYTFCLNKLQKLQTLYDEEKYKLSQKTSSFINAVTQVSNNGISDGVGLSSNNIVAKNSWLKLCNGNLVYGFTLQNMSKLPIMNFNLLLLEDNKRIWPKFRFECWDIAKNKSSFKFHNSYENNCMLNIIEKSCLSLDSESSSIIASVVDDWSLKSFPYFINGIVFINSDDHGVNDNCTQYINTEEVMVTSNLFLDLEFETFVKNSVLIEDLVTLQCTNLLSSYQIKCTIYHKDLKNLLVNNFKFDTKHEWFVHSSLSWLRTIICYLNQITPSEYILNVFSDSLVYTKTFVQVLTSLLPEHTSINCLDNNVPSYSNIDAVMLDLRELRRVFKGHIMNGQILIPRPLWNSTRLKLNFT